LLAYLFTNLIASMLNAASTSKQHEGGYIATVAAVTTR